MNSKCVFTQALAAVFILTFLIPKNLSSAPLHSETRSHPTSSTLWTTGGYFRGNTLNPLSYALEIEVDPDRYMNIYKYYDVFLEDDARWGNPTPSPREKIEYSEIQARYGSARRLIMGVHIGKKPVFEKKKGLELTGEELEFYHSLPDALYNEVSGTVEFNHFKAGPHDGIFPDLLSVKKVLDSFKKQIGEGDVQGHIVFNRPSIEELSSHPFRNTMGYVIYEHDRALLRRLEEEERQAQRDPSFIPALNFNSNYLAPVTQLSLRSSELIAHKMNHGTLSDTDRVPRAAIPSLRTSKYQPSGTKVGFELRMYDNPNEAQGRPYQGSFNQLLLSLVRAKHLLETTTLDNFAHLDGNTAFIPDESSFSDENGSRSLWLCNTVIQKYYPTEVPPACTHIRKIQEKVQTEIKRRLKADEDVGVYDENDLRAKYGVEAFVPEIDAWMLEKAKSVTGKSCSKFLERLREMDPKFLFPMRVWHENPIIQKHLTSDKSFSDPRLENSEAIRIKSESLAFYQEYNRLLCNDNYDIGSLEGLTDKDKKEKELKKLENELRKAIAHWAGKTHLFEFFENYELKNHFPSLALIQSEQESKLKPERQRELSVARPTSAAPREFSSCNRKRSFFPRVIEACTGAAEISAKLGAPIPECRNFIQVPSTVHKSISRSQSRGPSSFLASTSNFSNEHSIENASTKKAYIRSTKSENNTSAARIPRNHSQSTITRVPSVRMRQITPVESNFPTLRRVHSTMKAPASNRTILQPKVVSPNF